MNSPREIQRKSYSKKSQFAEIPHLLRVQVDSFEDFLQQKIDPEKRKSQGLQRVFQEIFPISDVHENYSLEFVKYVLGTPRYNTIECQLRNMTYAAPLRATLRLLARKPEGNGKKIKGVLEQDVYLGELPLLTEQGTFVINGAERVVVSQLHRSPGVFFDEEVHPNGKKLFSARIIPFRGSWVEFKIDVNDIMYVYIDTRRKLPATVLIRALGYDSNDKILDLFYPLENVDLTPSQKTKIIGKISGTSVIDRKSGEITLSAGDTITEDHWDDLKEKGVSKLKIIKADLEREELVIVNTLSKDSTTTQEEALAKIFSLIRPGETPTTESAAAILERLFFSPKRYDIGDVGRYKINQRLKVGLPDDQGILDKKDFLAIINYLVELNAGRGDVDDIDHLGNRRARSVGELLADQFSVGLSRMGRTIRERMSLRDTENISPHELVNARTVSAVIDAFFGSSQLSQFMDQTNPLAELTHKRRLSALGPGGLTRERAGFEVRDVHHTHYGRMCPVETPEGPNIGLIASLSTFARINKYGFLETPYRKVKNGRVTDKIEHLTADQEDNYTIAQANEPLEKDGKFANEGVKARQRGDFVVVPPEKIDYMDLSPLQLVSVAAALIPFLEHDDANRALMGSNMQRQAVPLLKTEAPYVGTGIERRAAVDSGAAISAKRDGIVEFASADRIVIRPTSSSESEFVDLDEYQLIKFKRTNQDTCINQKPLVKVGERVAAGEVIADGAGTSLGDLALGANALVAFLPWRGYNFEDAVIISERLITNDIFSSIHVEEFELQVRDTKRGPEELTREIPNVSEEATAHLDESGVVRIGAEIEAGDVLVGKVTPKGETELSPEERLLRAIFGEKAGDVRDASLKAPPGMKGIVINTQVYSRKEHTDLSRRQEKSEIAKLRRQNQRSLDELLNVRDKKLLALVEGETARTIRKKNSGDVIFRAGYKFKDDSLDKIDIDNLAAEEGWTENARLNKKVQDLLGNYGAALEARKEQLEVEIDKVVRGAELPPGVVQLVKVQIATERKISVGDKVAGRHGNKGVISKVVPVEDMPYLPDGTPIDMILNPLGVPSRMNVGQILETHLGWAAKKLGLFVATPVFDGASLKEIKEELKRAGLPESGKTVLYDGRTGEPFDSEVTVGYMYMMKLSHLVDDKIHARSIGPYSLVTQQPLGGKAQFGGQRFGEMEVWALEAYGAAYTLQELLTYKSDDVSGRSKVYEAIVKGDNPPEPGVPESFNVLVKELQSLGMSVELLEH
ncbi:MAG: DNA-directed RNA polymerase subunit beta [candidate division Zixibacteria bacterium]|nr:DNA-directed RNA polymerase subunit beta [candidate division Zixibacteria bacterium]